MTAPPLTFYRNGTIVGGLLFNNDQLGAMSFPTSAIDVQIGIGSLVIPGTPGWVAGDRIAVFSGTALVFLGYVMNRGQQRENIETLAIETSYQLMDSNRQLIGRKVTDWAPGGVTTVNDQPVYGATTASALLLAFISTYCADLTIDTTTYVDTDTTAIPGRLYNSDGITDLAADLIEFTGKTVFLIPTADNEFELHFHALTSGATAGLDISDTGADGSTIFAPHRGASASWSAADLMNNIVARNQISTVAGSNSGSISTHGAGGLKFEANLSSSRDEDGLVVYANNIINHAGDEIPTYQCVIGPLTGTQIASIPGGSLINVTSAAMGLGGDNQRIAHITASISHDKDGNPVPGLWDAALELAHPLRQAAAALGSGGQGGYAGGLSNAILPADHVRLTSDSIPVGTFPVGNSLVIYGQVEDVLDRRIVQPGITVNFTLEQWEDEAETMAGSGWTLDVASDDTDVTGQVQCVLTRHPSGGATVVVVNVIATLA